MGGNRLTLVMVRGPVCLAAHYAFARRFRALNRLEEAGRSGLTARTARAPLLLARSSLIVRPEGIEPSTLSSVWTRSVR